MAQGVASAGQRRQFPVADANSCERRCRLGSSRADTTLARPGEGRHRGRAVGAVAAQAPVHQAHLAQTQLPFGELEGEALVLQEDRIEGEQRIGARDRRAVRRSHGTQPGRHRGQVGMGQRALEIVGFRAQRLQRRSSYSRTAALSRSARSRSSPASRGALLGQAAARATQAPVAARPTFERPRAGGRVEVVLRAVEVGDVTALSNQCRARQVGIAQRLGQDRDDG
jgi:hypothetical protein